MSAIPIIEVLRDIALHGRPQCNTDRIGSAWARQACRQGLARRCGVTWSHLDGTRQVAAYSLTRDGVEMLADDECAGKAGA